MINNSELKKIRNDAILNLRLHEDLKSVAIDASLKSIKALIAKHKSLEVIVLKDEKQK